MNGSELFVFHGYAQLWLHGGWVEATPLTTIASVSSTWWGSEAPETPTASSSWTGRGCRRGGDAPGGQPVR